MKNVIGGGFMPGGKHVLGKINQQRVFGTAKVGDRGQIVIPKEARELFGIKPGDTLLILGEAETGLIVSRPDVLNNLADELLNTVKKEDSIWTNYWSFTKPWGFPPRYMPTASGRWRS